jgi:hypothetical protein
MINASNQHLINALNRIDPTIIERIIKNNIFMEQLNLQAHKRLGNEIECLLIKHRIADAELALLALEGYLPIP